MPNAENMTAREELEQFAELLREADEQEKSWKEAKEAARGPFLELISEVVREEVALARETIVIEATEDPEEWCKLNYPLYRVVAVSVGPTEDSLAVTIEEHDAYRKFEFTFGGYKFGRTVKMKDKGFEAEAFYNAVRKNRGDLAFDGYELDDEVWEKLRNVVQEHTVVTYTMDEGEVSALMSEHPETVAIFQEFINPGVPQVALLPIKAVKDTEE